MMLSLLLASCAHEQGGAGGNARFVRAEIRTVARRDRQTPVVVSGEKLNKLIEYLPHVGTGKRNDFNGSWIAGLEIKLMRADGTGTVVTTDTELRWWTEGDGDWELEEGFRSFMLGLLNLGPATSQRSDDAGE
jgi:hypothetical protein